MENRGEAVRRPGLVMGHRTTAVGRGRRKIVFREEIWMFLKHSDAITGINEWMSSNDLVVEMD